MEIGELEGCFDREKREEEFPLRELREYTSADQFVPFRTILGLPPHPQFYFRNDNTGRFRRITSSSATKYKYGPILLTSHLLTPHKHLCNGIACHYLEKHKGVLPSLKLEILASGTTNTIKRKIIEASYIKRLKPELNNKDESDDDVIRRNRPVLSFLKKNLRVVYSPK
eukprot:sb/3472285/